MAVVLGLLVALSYGVGDFLGGLSSKRNRAVAVVAVSQVCSLSVLVVGFALVRPDVAAGRDLALGAVTGAVGLVGLVLLYRGLAAGAMGVVAPVTAVGAAVLPVAWGLLSGERPSPPALAGVVTALVAVALVASGDVAEDAAAGRREIALALGAGTAFGIVFILLAETSEDSGFWPLLSARAVQVALLGLVLVTTRVPLRVEPGTRRLTAGAGLLDVTANALFLLAAREGLLSLVSVLSSLYPAGTVVLARVVLGERLKPPQLAGIGLALAGVTLIAAG